MAKWTKSETVSISTEQEIPFVEIIFIFLHKNFPLNVFFALQRKENHPIFFLSITTRREKVHPFSFKMKY